MCEKLQQADNDGIETFTFPTDSIPGYAEYREACWRQSASALGPAEYLLSENARLSAQVGRLVDAVQFYAREYGGNVAFEALSAPNVRSSLERSRLEQAVIEAAKVWRRCMTEDCIEEAGASLHDAVDALNAGKEDADA